MRWMLAAVLVTVLWIAVTAIARRGPLTPPPAPRVIADPPTTAAMDDLRAVLVETGVFPGMVSKLEVGGAAGYEVVATMGGTYLRAPRQQQLQFAQVLQRAWAKSKCPGHGDACHVRLVDLMGNRLGGSGMFGSVVSLEPVP